jgi:hypothetical protein
MKFETIIRQGIQLIPGADGQLHAVLIGVLKELRIQRE